MSKPDFGEPFGTSKLRFVDKYGIEIVGSQRKRAVACVNACAGLTDDELKRVKAVNEMYEALLMVEWDDGACAWCGGLQICGHESECKRQSAIAKAEGREL